MVTFYDHEEHPSITQGVSFYTPMVSKKTPSQSSGQRFLSQLSHQLNHLASYVRLALRLLIDHRDDRPERNRIGKNG
jgi:hypothetical protein